MKEKEGLWSVTLPLGWGGITASAYEQPVITDMRVGWLGALGSLTSIWFIDFSPGTLQLANNYLISWLTRLLLIAASLIWCSTSTTAMEGFGGHTPPLTEMHVHNQGGWLQYPCWQPQQGSREQIIGEGCPKLTGITYPVHVPRSRTTRTPVPEW